MIKRNQLNRLENVDTLKKLVTEINEIYDPLEEYWHSRYETICSLEYLYDGKREGFRILFMGDVVCEESLEDCFDDTFGEIDFDDLRKMVDRICANITSRAEQYQHFGLEPGEEEILWKK